MRVMAGQPAHLRSCPNALLKSAALQHRPWNSARLLSRGLDNAEQFLARAAFERAPWLAVAFGGGIALWFALATPGQWIGVMLACCGMALATAALVRADGAFPFLRLAGILLPLAVALGCGAVWLRSHIVGQEPIAHPTVAVLTGLVLAVEAQPALERRRIVLATREPETGRKIRVRLNLPDAKSGAEGQGEAAALRRGAQVRVRARLVPPAAPMLPGAYNFARTVWFNGLAATGSVIDPPVVLSPGDDGGSLAEWQRRLSAHVRTRLDASEAGIAAALATGDMGGVVEADAEAMRDSGLAHLLSVSGLHVSAVIAAVYVLALRALALWPWLALRVRLPVIAGACGALAGIGYTLLTGSQVPTVRSCIGALLVLAALALGREPLSLRMLAIAAFLVLLLWPEAAVGPSFQMSFAAVLAIVALSGAAPVRRFLAPREESLLARGLRQLAMMLLIGVVIEAALMPIGLYHFHRSGLYGALANLVAIPLTTLVIMPAVLAALVLDAVGLGAPAWWVAGHAVSLLTGLAHWTASRTGAVTTLPAFGAGAFLLFVCGGLWVGLWTGRVRWFGLVPAVVGAFLIGWARAPDLMVSSDGRHVGLVADGKLYVLRETRSDFARDNLTELAGMRGEPVLITALPGTRCSRDACVVTLNRGGRDWRLLLTRSRGALPERSLGAACERVDIVISDRWLPRSCTPLWIKADRAMLERTGGLAFDLDEPRVRTVAEGEGRHGWWRPVEPRTWKGRRQLRKPPSPNPSVSEVGSEMVAS